MFQGYNRPKRSDIFGPSRTGGTINDVGERYLYQHGEGIGSFFSKFLPKLFGKVLPAVAKTVKNIAGSKIVKDTGKQLLDSTITGLTNVAADTISGSKTINESLSDELKNARSELSQALKKANKSRKFEAADEIPSPKPKKRKKARKKTVVKYKRRAKQSIFDEDD